ncbi:MAG: sigma factor-like helix-turn-helix DNA-binding protein [Patescibacteria group bacterium]
MKFNFIQLTAFSIQKKLRMMSSKNEATTSEFFELNEMLNQLTQFQVGSQYISYSDLSESNKSIVKESARLLQSICAKAIHQRFVELGYDNYNKSLKGFSPIELEDDLFRKGHDKLALKLQKIRTGKEIPNQKAKTFGYAPKPFNVNDEVLIAVFREDPVINFNSTLLMNTVYSFVYKKALEYGSRLPVERNGVDKDDFFSAGSIGYLAATLFWNPSYFKKANFTSYGWEFSIRYFREVIIRSRLIRFPNHVEELIAKVHAKIARRRQELLSQLVHVDQLQIEAIIAKELKEDILKIRDIFAMFSSPSTTLSSYIPSEQRLVRLDKPRSDDENGVEYHDMLGKVENDFEELIFTSLKEQLSLTIQTLSPLEQVILCLRYGLRPTPKAWQDSKFKAKSSLEWNQTPLRLHTLLEIGEIGNFSRERVRQVEAKALRKLRAPHRNSLLKGFLRDEAIQQQIDSEKSKAILKSFSYIYRDLDQSLYNRSTGNTATNLTLKEACQKVDSLNVLKFSQVKEIITYLLPKIYYRLVGLMECDTHCEFLVDEIVEILQAEKYDVTSNPTLSNAIGLLTFCSKNLIRRSSYHTPKLSSQTSEFCKAVEYLENNPYFLAVFF